MSQRFRLFAVCVVLVTLLGAAPAFTLDATSAAVAGATTATRIYIGQTARLTALIPADWSTDPSGAADYAGPDGFVGSDPIFGAGLSLDTACVQEAANPRFGTAPREYPATWHAEPACRIDSASGSVAGLVIPYPRPFSDWGGEVDYIAVYADPAHLTAVAATLDFAPDRVTPAAYLESVLDLVEAHSLWRDQVNWPRVRQQALADAAGARTIADTYPAIRDVLQALRDVGDGHSFFLSPDEVPVYQQGGPNGHPMPSGRRLPGGIGYVTLPGARGEVDILRRYGTTAEGIVAAIDQDPTCGWVVDLRENSGGAYGPMVTGVEALLGEGEILRWRDAAGHERIVELRGGHLIDGGVDTGRWADGAPYALQRPGPPVAVLVGLHTVSAGEATALAFVGRPKTRTFGQLTYGLTTANYLFSLFDGSWLALADAWMADRTGATHPSGVQPDEIVESGAAGTGTAADPVLQAALAWLQQQPACAGAPAATPGATPHVGA